MGHDPIETWPPETTGENKAVKEMIAWFVDHYEDPVNNCPHISAEGGYQFIYGGPYSAEDVLLDNYPKAADEDIQRCAELINTHCTEWSAVPEDAELWSSGEKINWDEVKDPDGEATTV